MMIFCVSLYIISGVAGINNNSCGASSLPGGLALMSRSWFSCAMTIVFLFGSKPPMPDNKVGGTDRKVNQRLEVDPNQLVMHGGVRHCWVVVVRCWNSKSKYNEYKSLSFIKSMST